MLYEALTQANVKFLTHSPSNQIFPIFPHRVIAELEKKYSFHVWEKVDAGHSAIRLVTSWATKEEEVVGFIEELKRWQ
jgi:threonine aldolase